MPNLSDSPLVITDGFSELFPLESVGDRIVECPLGEAQHLRGDPDSPLIQDLDGDLVPLADLADDVFRRDLDVVETK
jgi:hypothetical protein